MYPLKLVHVLPLVSIFYIHGTVAGPMEVPNRYQKANTIEQNDWRFVLSSIESRLKSLEFLYTSQLSPTLETRFENFQNRISGVEVKLLRIEALLTSKLDRMSDNISSKHFKDDMIQTDMFRKMEAAYDGITHRLAYMDRKSEKNVLKVQYSEKLQVLSFFKENYEAFTKKIDIMNNALTDKYDSIESQLSDIVDGMEEINVSFSNIEKGVPNGLWNGKNNSQSKQYGMEIIPKKGHYDEILNEVRNVCGNSSKILDEIQLQLSGSTQKDTTEKHFNNFSDYFENLMNDYASKVSDLGAKVTKSDHKIATHLSTIEKVVNTSEVEMQKALRALIIQVGGKMSPKNDADYEVFDQEFMSDISQKLDSNFDKIISTQNTFLESCHRLQMDESQMEGQISDILTKLIDNFEATTREHHHLLKKIEALLVKHDVHTKKELHQSNANIMALYEQYRKESKDTKDRYKQTNVNLEALFALIQNTLGRSNIDSKEEISKEKELIEYIQSLERALNYTKLEKTKLFDSFNATIETALRQTKQTYKQYTMEAMTDLAHNMSVIEKKIEELSNKLYTNTTLDILEYIEKIYKLVQDINENFGNFSNFTHTEANIDSKRKANETESYASEELNSIIRNIFFNNETNITPSSTVIPRLDIDIDVRSNFAESSANDENSTSNFNENIKVTSELNPTMDPECLGMSFDREIATDELAHDSRKPCSTNNQNTGGSSEEPNQNIKLEKNSLDDQLLQDTIFEKQNETYNGNSEKI